MDPSSPYAMQSLIGLKDKFDVAFACDTDHDRHGIVTQARRAAAAQPLPGRLRSLPVRATVRSGACRAARRQDRRQQQHDRSCRRESRPQLYEVPVGFKWFVDGLRRRLARIWRRRERRRVVPAPRRNGVDDGQRRNCAIAARGRDDGVDRPRSGKRIAGSRTISAIPCIDASTRRRLRRRSDNSPTCRRRRSGRANSPATRSSAY